jgi:transcriptional regulator with XRE-family HTH domain
MSQAFRDNLLSDEEGKKLYCREDLIFNVTEAICEVMENKGLSRKELADQAGVTKSNITQLLSGDHNMRLTTIADILFALGCKLTIGVAPLDAESFDQSIATTKAGQWASISPEPPKDRVQPKDGTGLLTQAA